MITVILQAVIMVVFVAALVVTEFYVRVRRGDEGPTRVARRTYFWIESRIAAADVHECTDECVWWHVLWYRTHWLIVAIYAISITVYTLILIGHYT